MKERIVSVVNGVKARTRSTVNGYVTTHSTAQCVALLAVAALLLVLAGSILFAPHKTRAVYYFPVSKTGAVRTEIRYLPRVKTLDRRLTQYVSDLVLGPENPLFEPLYDKGTKVTACFIRNGSAYIDLSGEALTPDTVTTSSERAYELFKKNVCTNFRNIARIYVYVDGIEVYSENVDDPKKGVDKR